MVADQTVGSDAAAPENNGDADRANYSASPFRKQSADPQLRELAALYDLTDRLQQARTFAEIYDAGFAAIAATLGTGRASILMFDDGGTMRFVSQRGLSEAYCRGVEGHSPWVAGATGAQPIFVERADAGDFPDRILKLIKDEKIGCLAFIPIMAGDAVIGKFVIYHDAPRKISEAERKLSVAIARQIGFGIARLRSDAARDAAEARLRDSEERFRLMSEQAPAMIWMSDADGKCLHLNRALREFWDVAEEDIAQFDWSETIHPDDAATVGGTIGEALTTQTGVRLQGRFRNAAGEYRFLQTDCRPRFSANGEFIGMIGVNVDVTDRVLAEQALRESEERFRALFVTETQGVILLDRDGIVREANSSAERLLGIANRDMVGKHIKVLNKDVIDENGDPLPPEQRPAGVARRTGKVVKDVVIGIRRPDGELRWVDMDAVPQWRAGEDEPWSVFLLLSDVTEQRRLASAEKTLAAEVNHRAKNMLALVRAIVRLSRSDSAEAFMKAVEGRIDALARAHSLLSDSKWSDVDLRSLVEEAVAAYRGTEESPRITLDGPPLSLKPAVAQPISLMVHELTTNAAKYGSLSVPEGRIAVAWEIDDAQELLQFTWVESGGPPVAEPEKTSFGSQLIRLTAERDLDGKVVKEWRREGLRAVIRIPTRHLGTATTWARRTEAQPPKRREQGELHDKRILLVEDNAVIASEMCETLEKFGCIVVGPGRTLNEAMRLAADEPIDAALLDVDLGGAPVYPVAEFLATQGTPFAFCTGFAIEHDIRVRWPDATALQKPVSQTEVAATINDLLST